MAEDQYDIGSISALVPGGEEWRLLDYAGIGDLGFSYPNYANEEPSLLQEFISLEEQDASSHSGRGSAHFSDTFGLPSLPAYAGTPSEQTDSPMLDVTMATRSAPSPLPRERCNCVWPDCEVSFARMSDLRRHVKNVHLPDITYRCTVDGCNRMFGRRDKLRAHVRAHEPGVYGFEKYATTAIPRIQYHIRSLGPVSEDQISDSGATSSSFLAPVDEHFGQGLNNNKTASTSATEYSCGPSEDISTISDEFSRKDSISTKSTTVDRTVSSKIPNNIYSANHADCAKVRLACPYRKHNPVKYNIHSHTTCAKSCWDSVARVKEHLIRHHIAPLQCQRCWACFNTEIDLSIHTRASTPCKIRPESLAEGINRSVQRRLRTRTRRDWSEAEKWKEVYTILFPKEKDIPTPYFVPIGDDAAAKNTPYTTKFSDPSDLMGLHPSAPTIRTPPKISLLEELPRLFGSRLEVALSREGAPALDDRQRSEIVSLVAECCDDLLARDRTRNLGREYIHTPPAGYMLPVGQW